MNRPSCEMVLSPLLGAICRRSTPYYIVINGVIIPINGLINGYITAVISGVITLLVTGRGPPCIIHTDIYIYIFTCMYVLSSHSWNFISYVYIIIFGYLLIHYQWPPATFFVSQVEDLSQVNQPTPGHETLPGFP